MKYNIFSPRSILLVSGTLVGFFTLSVLYLLWSSAAVVSGQIYDPKLIEKVSINRDEHGIPSIIAKNDMDMYRAQGYAHAQDRLFQMILYKHMFSGRMSELLGDKALRLDEYMRTFGLRAGVKASYPYLNATTRQTIEAYAGGVNQYIKENKKTIEMHLLGYKLEPWEPFDTLVVQKAIAFDLSRHWPTIIRNTGMAAKLGMEALDHYYPAVDIEEPSVTDQDLISQRLPYNKVPKVYPDGPEINEEVIESLEPFALLNQAILDSLSADETMSPGSNAWAVSGERTLSGHPLIASDPHLAYNIPNVFYLNHLKSDESNISGGSIPGSPGVIIGRNAHISWGFTNSRLAQTDIYYGKDISGKKERHEEIRVKGGESVHITYLDTDYGTIVSKGDSPYEVALKWTGMLSRDRTMDAILALNAGKSLDEVKPSLKFFHTPSQNLMIGDSSGKYGFFALGVVPIRTHSGRVAVPATPEYQWKVFIPFWQMPHVENPKRGYVMNANNQVVSKHYGYNLSRLRFDDFRGTRLAKLLKADKVLSLEDMKGIQFDNVDQEWLHMRPILLSTKPNNDRGKEAVEALRDWDGVAEQSSYQVTIYSAWQREIAKRIYHPVRQQLLSWEYPLFDDYFVYNELVNNGVGCHNNGKGCQDFLSDTLESVLVKLEKDFGTQDMTQWFWKEKHRAVFTHGIFKKLPVFSSMTERLAVVDGTRDSINRSRWFSGLEGFGATQGACLRMLVDLDSDEANYSMPMGQSANIFSKHYDDLLPLWAKGVFVSLPHRHLVDTKSVLEIHAEAD